ncbi:MAG: stage V sporulation protein AC [Lachnospiraceae bacterium]|nr:stage V sporulation protein AC [Lachnospiraceae bacterium]
MNTTQNDEEYNKYVEAVTPKHSCFKNCVNAFLIGGLICTFGQFINNLLVSNYDFNKDDASSYTSIILILCSVLLTGLNLYKKIAKFGGAGALVPITGFANSVAAPTIEYQKEGEVFGKGVKIFTIAGPVILFGILTSWILGLIYWFLLSINII